MIRTFDDDLINSLIAKDPAFCPIKNAKDAKSVFFLYEEGVGIFPSVLNNGVMKVHACILPEARGKRALKAARDCIDWVFTHTNAHTLQTKADKTKRHLLIFNALIFGQRSGEDERFIYYEVQR